MSEQVSEILQAIQSGDQLAAEKLLPAVYNDLRRMAAKKISEQPPGQTLQATALVHEAYLRIVCSNPDQQWDHRGHFFIAAAQAMRCIVIDNIRAKQRLKRGGEHRRVELQDVDLVLSVPNEDLLDLAEALERFSQNTPKEANLVQLRFFAGLSLEEAAEAMGISRATASRYWSYARARLLTTLGNEDNSAS